MAAAADLPRLLGLPGQFLASTLFGPGCCACSQLRARCRGGEGEEELQLEASPRTFALPSSVRLGVQVVEVVALSGAAARVREAQQRLTVEVALDAALQDPPSSQPVVAEPYRGGDAWEVEAELEFQARPEELMAGRLHFCLHAHDESPLSLLSQALAPYVELPLGSPWSCQLGRCAANASTTVLCEGRLDLLLDALPACRAGFGPRPAASGRHAVWESGQVRVPLVAPATHGRDENEVCAELLVAFAIDADPEVLLSFAYRAKPGPWPSGPIKSPDCAPEGWVCREGPGGRLFWHHTALGPPPWERPFDELADRRPGPGLGGSDSDHHAALVRSMLGKVAGLRGARPARQQRQRP